MLKLIDNWKQAWRMWTVQISALVLLLPDLYAGVQALGWLDSADCPPALAWSIRILGGVGVVARLIRQSKLQPPEK